jgi:hypothetical protein
VRRQGLEVVLPHVQAGLGVGTCEGYAGRSHAASNRCRSGPHAGPPLLGVVRV